MPVDPEDLLDAGGDAADAGAPTEATGDAPAETAVAKKVKPVRIWGLGLLVVVAAGTVGGLEFGLAPFVADSLRANLAGEGMELDEQTAVSASILGSSVGIDQLRVHHPSPEGQATPYAADEIRIDLDLGATLFGPDLVIERLAATSTAVDLRRRADGTIPGVSETVVPPREPEQEPRSWLDLWEQAQKWRQRYEDYDWVLGRSEDEAPTAEPEPAPGWANARYYAPPPDPDQPSPRLLIRELAISGAAFKLPDAVGGTEAPMDLVGYRVEGDTVTWRLEPGETMTLAAEATTRSAGGFTIDLTRSLTGGSLDMGWSGLPVALLADDQVSGGRLAVYGPSGSTDLTIDATWSADMALSGSIVLTIHDLRLDPQPGAEAQAKEIARRLEQNPVSPVVWELGLTGTLTRPRITGFDLKPLMDAVVDSAKREALRMADEKLGAEKDKALDRLGDELDGKVDEDTKKQIEGAADQVGDGLRNLFGGGKD